MEAKHPGGRPPKYRSAKALEKKIDQYFESCKGHPLIDEMTGKPVIYKGFPVYEDQRPPTVTGLALALGFATRASLMDYQGKPQFEEIILRAKSRIEQYTEERLFDRDGSAGARFSLQNNFKGWKKKAEVSLSAAEGEDIMAEIAARMAGEPMEALEDEAAGTPEKAGVDVP